MFLRCSLWAQSNVLMIVNPNSTLRTSIPSEISLNATSTTLLGLQATIPYEAVGRSAVASSSAASASIGLSVAALSQTAAAASSQALAGASTSTNAGSEVGVFAQIIIAIGIIPVEILIVSIVLGLHRLKHRRPSRPRQTRSDSAEPIRDSLPYLQPKAELEDEQRRRHELHGERIVHELDGQEKIFQMPDETGSLVSPLQVRQTLHRLPKSDHASWEMLRNGRYEVIGDEYAQELECPIQEIEESIGVKSAPELESPVGARDEPVISEWPQELASPEQASEPVRVKDAQSLVAPFEDLVTDSTNVDTRGSHFMLRQQQMLDVDDTLARDQHKSQEQ